MSMPRCSWCEGDSLHEQYHDEEWGVPVFDATQLFERLSLEGMQAGLSWLTVLRKRAHMRDEFYAFAIDRLAAADDVSLARWLQDAGLIRHRGKLSAMINNARRVQDIEGFSDWLWSFAPNIQTARATLDLIPAVTAESTAMSKALKKAGFSFVGPTICYAFMQSVGMVNDHVSNCWRRPLCEGLHEEMSKQANPQL
jgi:DNA-3-methyladenine glycosylase I